MRRISLIQVGDVHYPEWLTLKTPIDVQDPSFSGSIIRDLQFSSIQSVLSNINRLIHKSKIDAVIFVGDLTSYGETSKLRQAFKHLHLLCHPSASADALPEIIAVPGNHDVNKADARLYGRTQKFELFRELCQFYEWSPAPLNEACHVELSAEDSTKLHIISINTSTGCWDPQALPQVIEELLDDAQLNGPPIELARLGNTDADPARPEDTVKTVETTRFYQVYDQMDTPYVSARMLESLTDLIQQIPRTEPIVIVGHHNIMPQKTPRIMQYSEMLNAGFIRRELLALNRRLIYLHGHIHQDPVEIVSDVRYPASRIVSVAAPQIADGFNELSFFFDHGGRSIGFRLTQHRVNPDGRIHRFEDQDQFFISLRESSNVLLEQSVSGLWRVLKDAASRHSMNVFAWVDLFDVVRAAKLPLNQDELEDVVILLHSARVLRIENIGRSREEWRVNLGGTAL